MLAIGRNKCALTTIYKPSRSINFNFHRPFKRQNNLMKVVPMLNFHSVISPAFKSRPTRAYYHLKAV